MNHWTPFLISINLDLGKFGFRNEGEALSNQIVLAIGVFLLIFILAFAAFLYFRSNKHRENFNRRREEAKLKLMLSEYGLNKSDLDAVIEIAGSDSTGRFLPMLESKSAFELAVRKYKAEEPDSPVLKKVGQVRQKLRYGFSNLTYPFGDTRMLGLKTKVECRIPQASRDVVFATQILKTNETYFVIHPPPPGEEALINKGQSLNFRIEREEDTQYEFNATVFQPRLGDNQIILEHSRDVQKLIIRSSERSAVDLDTKFYVVKESEAINRGHAKFTAKESQYAFNGHLRDLSAGGGLLVIDKKKQNPQKGDYIIFNLPMAQVNEDLVAEVMRITELSEEKEQIHLRFTGLKEINRLKINKFLKNQTLNEQDEASSEAS